MLKSVVAEDALKEYLQNVITVPSNNGFVLGLILGQRTNQRDFVIHLPIFQNTKPKNEDSGDSLVDNSFISEIVAFNSIQDVDVKSFILYSKQVAALLPGGMWILGIFSVGSDHDGILNSNQSTQLQNFMTNVFNKLSKDKNLSATNTPTPEKLIMNYNKSTKKATCKTVNLQESKWYLSNMDWKFHPQRWIQVECNVTFDYELPLKETENVSSALLSNFQELLNIYKDKIENSHCIIQSEIFDKDKILDSIDYALEDDEFFVAELQTPCPSNKQNTEVKEFDSCGEFLMGGHICSRIFMHSKTTVGDTIKAIKEDIIRSLQARIDLHTDALIEETEGSPEEKILQHDLPRRVLIPLPYSKVKLSNYLFPGETTKDSMASVQQLLAYQLDTDEEFEILEQESTPDMMLSGGNSESDYDLSAPTTPQPTEETRGSIMSFLTVMAIIAIFFALMFSLFLYKDEDNIIDKKTK